MKLCGDRKQHCTVQRQVRDRHVHGGNANYRLRVYYHTGNTLIGNQYGIELLGENCIVRNNCIQNSGDYGMKLDNLPTAPCFDNDLYQNDFINNGGAGAQAYDSGTTNTWNLPTTVGYCYSGSSYTNYIGNYWDDYTGSDPDGNGIGNTGYPLFGGAGATVYPAMVQWRLYGDVNRDGNVNMMDTGAGFGYIFHGVTICNPWAANVNCDENIDMMDAGAIIGHIFQYLELNSCCQGC